MRAGVLQGVALVVLAFAGCGGDDGPAGPSGPGEDAGAPLADAGPASCATEEGVRALVFAPSMFGGLLPSWWRENVISLLPGPASDSIAIGHLDDADIYLAPGLAAVVLVAWLALTWFGTRAIVNRRDA